MTYQTFVTMLEENMQNILHDKEVEVIEEVEGEKATLSFYAKNHAISTFLTIVSLDSEEITESTNLTNTVLKVYYHNETTYNRPSLSDFDNILTNIMNELELQDNKNLEPDLFKTYEGYEFSYILEDYIRLRDIHEVLCTSEDATILLDYMEENEIDGYIYYINHKGIAYPPYF